MQQKKRWIKMLGIIFVLTLTYGVICFYLSEGYISPPRKYSQLDTEGVLSVEISGPGYPLPIWVSRSLFLGDPRSLNVYILVHGYNGNRSSWRNLLPGLLDRDQEFVVPAMRAHDTNPAPYSTFGKYESKEVLAVVDWVRSQYKKYRPSFSPKIILVGTSLGAGACWQAVSEDPTIDGIVSDSCFASLEEASDRWMERTFPGASRLLRPMMWIAEHRVGATRAEIQPVLRAAEWKGKPCLIVHGEKDKLLPLDHAVRLSKSAGCEKWIVSGASHSECSDLFYEKYIDKLIQFAQKIP